MTRKLPPSQPPLHPLPPWRPKHLTREKAEQIEQMVSEIVSTAPFGILIVYIEHGEITRATPGMIGKCQQLHDATG